MRLFRRTLSALVAAVIVLTALPADVMAASADVDFAGGGAADIGRYSK